MMLRQLPFGLVIGKRLGVKVREAGAQRLGYYASLSGQASSFQFKVGIMYNVNHGPKHCRLFGDTLVISN